MMSILALALVAAVHTGNPSQAFPGEKLLLAPWKYSAEAAASIVKGVGRVMSKDKSGLYVIELNPGVTSEATETKLRARKDVRFVLPYSVLRHSTSSVEEINDQIEYIEAGNALHGLKADAEGETGGTDFLERLRDYMLARADANGQIDQNAIRTAVESRKHMTPVDLGVKGKTNGSWQFIGPKNTSPDQPVYNGPGYIAGRVNCIAFDPAVKTTYYAGSAAGGLWKTVDDGTTWTFLSKGWTFQNVSALAVDPKNSKIIYAGTGDYWGEAKGYQNGIMKSVDGGLTWTNVGAANFGKYAISKIQIDRFDSNIVIVTAGHGAGPEFFHGGVWRSTDYGTSWTQAAGIANTPYSDSTIFVGEGEKNETYYIVGDSSNGGAIYTSRDYGATWHANSTPNTTAQSNLRIAAVSTINEYYLIYLLEPFAHKVYGMDYFGRWADLTAGFFNGTTDDPAYNWSQGFYDTFLATEKVIVGPNQYRDALFVGLINIVLGTQSNTTESWFDVGSTYTADARTHNDQHAIAVCPTDPNTVLFGNDGGIYKFVIDWSTGSYTISSLNATLPIGQIYKVNPHPTDPKVVLSGAQDNGAPSAGEDLENWAMLTTGDGGDTIIDLVRSVLYTTSTSGTMDRFGFNGVFQKRIHGAWDDPKAFIMPLVRSTDNKYLFSATNVLNIYNPDTGIWEGTPQVVTGGAVQGAGNFVNVISTTQSEPDIVYTGSMDGFVWRSDLSNIELGDPTVKRVDNFAAGPMPQFPVLALSTDPENSSDLIAGLGGTGHHHVYRCADTMAATPKWIDISGNLPDTPVNTVARDPFQPRSMFYIGTDIGVFVTLDSGASWSPLTEASGLPTVPVYDLKFGAGFMYAATFGRGIWRIPIAAPTALSSLTLSPTSVAGGTGSSGTVTMINPPGGDGVFVDLSSNIVSAATVPDATKVGSTGTTSTFLIDTYPVAVDKVVTVTASFGGSLKTAKLTVKAPLLSAVTVPSKSVGGLPFTGSITLASPAPKTGVSVGLSSNNAAVTVPSSVPVPGAKTANFTATSQSVSAPTSVTVTATLNGITQTDVVVIMPPTVSKIAISPNPCFGGLTAKATVTIAEKAPTGGLVLKLSSGNTAAASVPSTMTIAAGSTTGTFNIATHGVDAQRTATITAGDSTNSTSVVLTVNVATLSSMKMASSTVVGGLGDVCTVNLVGQAGPSGTVVTISADNTAVAQPPASVTVPALKPSVGFTVPTKGVNAATSVTLTAKLSTIAKTVSFTVNPSPLSSVTMASSSVVGGIGDVATVRLVGQAGPSGTVVSLASSNTAVMTVPATVTVPAYKTLIASTAKTFGVAATTSVTLTAKLGALTKTAVFSVTKAALSSVTTTTTSVKGGTAVSGKVTLNGFAPPANAVVTLKSDSTSATVPASVTVLKNASSAAFTVTTKVVTTTTTVHITATYGGVTKTATLTLTP